MLDGIVSLFLIAIIVTDIVYSIKKTKNDKRIIKVYEDNTEATKKLDEAITKYMKSMECEEDGFELRF